MTTVIPFKKAPQDLRSRTDTLVITGEIIKVWKSPQFQRPLRENEKVRTLCAELKTNGGVIPGIITLGTLKSDTFVIDGQHRIHAFLMSELKEAFCDVRIMEFDSMDAMGKEFVRLNSSLVKMRPDDVLRGLEGSHQTLQIIRHLCPFVGYDYVRRELSYQPMMSMATAIRCWTAACGEAPATPSASAFDLVQGLTVEEARKLSDFMNYAYKAWGREHENIRLWGALNMAVCGWLYRRMVLEELKIKARGKKRSITLSAGQFQKCLMALAANRHYVEWLWGRNLSERDRMPCYRHIRRIFTNRLKDEGLHDVKMPAPAWAVS